MSDAKICEGCQKVVEVGQVTTTKELDVVDEARKLNLRFVVSAIHLGDPAKDKRAGRPCELCDECYASLLVNAEQPIVVVPDSDDGD